MQSQRTLIGCAKHRTHYHDRRGARLSRIYSSDCLFGTSAAGGGTDLGVSAGPAGGVAIGSFGTSAAGGCTASDMSASAAGAMAVGRLGWLLRVYF